MAVMLFTYFLICFAIKWSERRASLHMHVHCKLWLSCNMRPKMVHTHIHIHTHTYIQIYIYSITWLTAYSQGRCLPVSIYRGHLRAPPVVPEVQPLSQHRVLLDPSDPVEDDGSLPSLHWNTHAKGRFTHTHVWGRSYSRNFSDTTTRHHFTQSYTMWCNVEQCPQNFGHF